jgi:hypothetical protein
MAKIKRITPAEPVKVEQAQLADPGQFPFSAAEAEQFKVAGDVLTELGRRKRAAEDSLAVSEMRKLQELTAASMTDFMVNNPNPALWGPEMNRLLGEQSKAVTKLKASPDVRKEMEVAQELWSEKFRIDNEILATIKTIDNDIKATGAGLINAIGLGDEQKISEARAAHEEALLRRDRPDVAAIKMIETLGQGEKQRIAVLIGQKKYGAARELARSTKSLTPTEREAQLNIIDREEARDKNKAKNTSQFIQDAAHEETVRQLVEDPDSFGQEQFDALPFNKENREMWAGILNKRTEVLKDGKDDPFVVGSGVRNITNSGLSRQLEQDVKNLPSVNDIVSKLGDITVEDAEEHLETLRRRKNKDDVMNNQVVRNMNAYYQDLFEIKAFAGLTEEQLRVREKGGTPVLTQEQLEANATGLMELKRDFNRWLLANEADIKSGKISDADVELKARELTRGPDSVTEDITVGFWRGAWEVLRPSNILTKTPGEAISEFKAEKKVEMLVGTTPRSINQLYQVAGELKGLDRDAAIKYLDEHRDKFGI